MVPGCSHPPPVHTNKKNPTEHSPRTTRRSRLKTVTSTKQGAIRLPDDAPDSTSPRRARLDVPGEPQRRFSISEDPESDTTSSDIGSGEARDSHESDRHAFLPLPPARREFAGRVPKPKGKPKPKPKN